MIGQDKPLSNIDIDNYYAGDKRYRSHVYLSDIKSIPKNTFTITLVDFLHDDDIMGHWVLLKDAGDYLECFNSFGVTPSHDMRRLAGHRKIKVNRVPVQFPTSSLCGFYCIYVADKLLAGEDFGETMNSLPALYGNPDVLSDYFK